MQASKKGTSKYTLVAEYNTQPRPKKGVLVGFAEIESNGHIDCFYCHKDYQRQGAGRLLHQAIETKAADWNLDHLFVEASITARPFFEAMGFSLIKEQAVFCRGHRFVNFEMRKRI